MADSHVTRLSAVHVIEKGVPLVSIYNNTVTKYRLFQVQSPLST